MAADSGHLLLRADRDAFGQLQSRAFAFGQANNVAVVSHAEDQRLRLAAFFPQLKEDGRGWALCDIVASDSPAQHEQNRKNQSAEEPPFFTIMGPEGVGKTTLCNNLIRIFSDFPIAFRQIHHTGEWKTSEVLDDAMREAEQLKHDRSSLENFSSVSASSGAARTLARALLPAALKQQVGSFRAELGYKSRLGAFITKSLAAGEFLIIDRYCYDRLVRWKNLKKPLGQRLASALVCRTMRRPSHVFVLRDEPERIHARKPVMPVWEIGRHQQMLVECCERFQVSFETVEVGDMSVEDLASHVARRMIILAGPRMIALMDTGLKAGKETPGNAGG